MLGLALVVGGAIGAAAQPTIQTVGTHSLIMKDDVTEPIYLGSRKFSFNVRSKFADPPHQVQAPTPGGPSDPSLGGGLLEIHNSAGTGEIVSIPLPVELWRLTGDPTGEFRYVFTSPPPVWKVYVKGHKISVRGGKDAWPYTLDELSQGSIAVRLTLGTDITYCSDALPRTSGDPPSSASYDHAGKFQARPQQLAPTTCPPLP